jgi:hypothetical protein
MTANPRTIRLAFDHNQEGIRSYCYCCEEKIDGGFWDAGIEYLSDQHRSVHFCESCVNYGPGFVDGLLAEKIDNLSERWSVGRKLKAHLALPTADEISEATIIPDLPFSARRVSEEVFERWQESRPVYAEYLNADTCEIRQEGDSFYVRSRRPGSDTRGWIHEIDLPDDKVETIRARMKPRPPAPYSERDPDIVPF